jgi:very-short-patch-repair endonuclease
MGEMKPTERLQALTRPGKDSDGEVMLAQQIAFQKPYLPMPVREYHFARAVGRRWRFDFCWPDRKFAVEVEGGVYRAAGGAHQRPRRFLADMEKYNTAAALGWTVWRFSTEQVEAMHAYDAIKSFFAERVAQ